MHHASRVIATGIASGQPDVAVDAEVLADGAAKRGAPTADQAADAEADAFLAPREVLDDHPAVGHLQVVVLVGQPIAAGADQPGAIGHPADIAAGQRGRLAVDLGDAHVGREDKSLLDPLDGELAGLGDKVGWAGEASGSAVCASAFALTQIDRSTAPTTRDVVMARHRYGSTGRLTLSVVTSPARTCTLLAYVLWPSFRTST